jgi:hypothetical protein
MRLPLHRLGLVLGLIPLAPGLTSAGHHNLRSGGLPAEPPPPRVLGAQLGSNPGVGLSFSNTPLGQSVRGGNPLGAPQAGSALGSPFGGNTIGSPFGRVGSGLGSPFGSPSGAPFGGLGSGLGGPSFGAPGGFVPSPFGNSFGPPMNNMGVPGNPFNQFPGAFNPIFFGQ